MATHDTAPHRAENTPALLVTAWWDPELAVHGHDPAGLYTETFWLPVLGPAATVGLRWLVRRLAEEPRGFEVPLGEFARDLGLGTSKGRNGPAARCVERLCYFGLARQRSCLEVRTHVPTLSPHLLRRLTRSLRERHGVLLAGGAQLRSPPSSSASSPASTSMSASQSRNS